MTKTVKFNATTRSTLMTIIPDGTSVHDKISSNGIMDAVELTETELASLHGYCDVVEGTNINWHNGKMRIRREFQDMVVEDGSD